MLEVQILLQEKFALFAAKDVLSPSLDMRYLVSEERFLYFLLGLLDVHSPFSYVI